MSLTPWAVRPTTGIWSTEVRIRVPPSVISMISSPGPHQHRAHLGAVALGGADGDDALGAAALGRELLHRGALAIAVFGHAEHGAGLRHHQGDDPLALVQHDAAHAVGTAAHGADMVLAEAHRLAGGGEEHQVLLAVGDGHADQDLVLVQVDGDDAARQRPGELGQRGLLDRAGAGGHEDEMALLIGAHRQHGVDALALLQRQQIDHGPAARAAPGLRQLIDLEPVDPAAAGEAQDRVVGVGDEDPVDEVLFLGRRSRSCPCRRAAGPGSR